jgi:hypothetical protein
MQRLFLMALAVLIARALVAAPQAARACSCAGEVERVILPLPGSTGLPPDLAIWSLGDASLPGLTLEGEALVPETFQLLAAGTLRRWRPSRPLQTETRYLLEIGGCEGCETLSFTTGTGIASDPLPPAVVSASWHEEGGGLFGGTSSCGETAFFRIRIDSAPGTLVLLDVGKGGGEGREEAELAEVARPGGASSLGRAELLLGRVACGPDVWDFDRADRAPFRVAALDVSGRFSGWSERDVVEAPGCQSGPAGSVGLLGLLLLARRRLVP